MALLEKYQDFLDRVDELGFMTLSHIMPGLPSLTAETLDNAWHTGDYDTDPWCWKDRAAEAKRLAYGCILGGHKGFISARMYPVFYTAFHPEKSMTKRWTAGEVKQTTWQLWQLFEEKTLLNTSDIRCQMGVTMKKGGSRVDASIQELQRDYYITMAGSRRKVDKNGSPYGWPACVYDRVINWAPTEWMSEISGLRPGETQEMILDIGAAIGKNVNRNELANKLGIY